MSPNSRAMPGGQHPNIMLDQFHLFLGPARTRALVILLGLTGLISLILNALEPREDWMTTAQTMLLLIFLVGTVIIIGGRMDRQTRLRWLAILAPAVGAILLGVLFVPHLLLPLSGAAVGWIIAGGFVFRPRVPNTFQAAVRHLRKGEYEDAVESMNAVIKDDPDNENYYRFRAEVFRLWGKLDRARKDYEKMVALTPDSAVGYNGLAEVQLQSGRYAEAREAGLRALELAPEEWVAAYNLGMIEDRLEMASEAVTHLQQALQHRVPDARHRLLIQLYLARAYSRLGDETSVEKHVAQMRKEKNGLEEWQNLLTHEQAVSLRAVLADDIQLATDLVEGKVKLA